jgi:predicted HAD superfamily Cof-like phosphohydrolase
MSLSTHVVTSVGAFHRAVGVDRLHRLTQREQFVMVALRATLIEEETREYKEALTVFDADRTTENLQHAAKEAADLLYVLAGTADVLGVSEGTQDASLNRLRAERTAFMWDAVLWSQLRILNDELTDLGRAIHFGDDTIDLVDDLINDLHYVTISLHHSARCHGIPLEEAFDAVHTSNMSKIDPETGQPFERRFDGKVLKGPSYQEADLSWLMAA